MSKFKAFRTTVLVSTLLLFTTTAAAQTYNFDTCGAVGRFGPSQSDCNSAYSGTNLDGEVTIEGNGIQEWTAPSNGVYRIKAAGAEGGDAESNQGGEGAVVVSKMNLNGGQTYHIIVGQRGYGDRNNNGNAENAGGGGGSFFYESASDSNPLVVAGGGGGGGNTANEDAEIGTSGSVDGGSGGLAGNSQDNTYHGGTGAGWDENGFGRNSCTYTVEGGDKPASGAEGGTGFADQGDEYIPGGFGGGGGGSGACSSDSSGGGGGYSGGGVDEGCCTQSAGGGGSYDAGNRINAFIGNTGDGYVTIEVLNEPAVVQSGPSFTDSSSRHAFKVSAVVDAGDGGANDDDSEVSCDLVVDDNNGNSKTYQMSIDRSYGDSTEAKCTYDQVYSSDVSGWGKNENVDVTVEVDDSGAGTTRSSSTQSNSFPDQSPSVSLEEPLNNVNDIETNPVLEASVSDPESDDLTVTFFGGSNNPIGSVSGVTGGTASVEWSGRSSESAFSWYAEVDDGVNSPVTSSTYNFETGLDTAEQFNPYRQFIYRKPINLTDYTWSPSFSSTSAHLVKVDTSSLISQGKLNQDCTDLRFTDSDSTTILNVWMERDTCNSAETKFYVQVPDGQSIVKQNHPIYMYYGNNSMARDLERSVKKRFDLETPSPSSSSGGNSYHRCWIEKPNGEAKCSGRNQYGQLGDGTTSNSDTQVTVSGQEDFVGIATGAQHSCGFKDNGEMYCWGRNQYGQLGDGSTSQSSTPVKVTGMDDVVDIALGDYFSCAVESGGAVYCWGQDSYGELGTESNDRHTDGSYTITPTRAGGVGDLGRASSVSASGNHVCAVEDSGDTYCWGRNNNGQLGDGTTSNSEVPVQVNSGEGLGNAVKVAVGDSTSCAVEDTGTTYCWGRGGEGQLGDGNTGNHNAPVQVHSGGGLGDAYDIAVNKGGSTCGLDTGSGLYCWGDSNSIPGTGSNQDTPTEVTSTGDGLNNPVSVHGGYNSMCSVDRTGNGFCWGTNFYGEFGTGGTSDYSNPAQVSGYNLGGLYEREPGKIEEVPALTDSYSVDSFNIEEFGPEETWMHVSGVEMSDVEVF